MYFQSIKGLTIAIGLFITTIAVKYTAVILVTIILTTYKKGLKLSGIKVLPLLNYN